MTLTEICSRPTWIPIVPYADNAFAKVVIRILPLYNWRLLVKLYVVLLIFPTIVYI